jgi:hypothetical protein
MLLMALIKIPIAGLMLWMPFRNDEAMRAPDVPGPSDEDGGSRTLPGGPSDPHPHRPLIPPGGCSGARPPRRPSPPAQAPNRRGPHRAPVRSVPRRVRVGR